MGKIVDGIFKVLAVVAGLLLLFITLSISWSILARAIGVSSPVWIVQFTEYSLLWITFLGTAWLLSKGRHVTIELLTQRINQRANRILKFAHSIVGMALCGSLCWYGALLTWDHFNRHVIDVQAINVPKAFVIIVVPAGFLLLFVQFTRNLINLFRTKDA